MGRHVAIIGGSVAGLASRVGLARRGWPVDVIERDLVLPNTNHGDEAFLAWKRPGRAAVPPAARVLGAVADAVARVDPRGRRLVAGRRHRGAQPVQGCWRRPSCGQDEDDSLHRAVDPPACLQLALRRVRRGASLGCRSLRCPRPPPGSRYGPSCVGPAARRRCLKLDDDKMLDADVVFDWGGRRLPVPGMPGRSRRPCAVRRAGLQVPPTTCALPPGPGLTWMSQL